MVLKKEDIRELLGKRFAKDVHTKLSMLPKPMGFKDMERAAKRIKTAYEQKQSIAIVGDYDADGVISTCILSEFFDKMDIDYDVYIPNRFEDGYGLNPNIVKKLKSDLIITVDNGITANSAGELCEELGIDLIITDHHSVPEVLPKAYAIVNPKQDDCEFAFCEICGAQVAWYLCAAIKEVCEFNCDLTQWFDLLSIAIMADMMELRDLNRVLVRSGLKSINKNPRPAFLAIQDMFKKSAFSSSDISFLIAPLINCTGRMDDARLSYDFIRSSSYKEALFLLEKIVGLNESRKQQESELFEQSLKMVKDEAKIIVVWGENWHEGVIGIVASRLARRFKKPAIVFSCEEQNAKGSARSVGEIDILSIVSNNAELLLGFGGHKGAAGMSIEKEKLPLFRQALEDECAKIPEERFVSHKEVLGELEPSHIDFELLEILENYEPYGVKNPLPYFCLKNAFVKSTRYIGKDGKHLKLILKTPTKTLEALFFNFDKEVNANDNIDIIFQVSKNSYRGLVTPQLLIKQID